MSEPFPERLRANAKSVEATLERLLSAGSRRGEITRPDRLIAAMRYAALGGGKRVRPFLVVESARIFGTTGSVVTAAAAALECLHCYSLVHDDLPAMDDDDVRRGRATVHRAFDEATAILAGDGLLTLAFDVLAELEADAETRIALVSGLARAAGLGGMAGGQMLDIAAEGKPQNEAAVLNLQAMKTGALFRFACEAGAILAQANDADRRRLVAFGETIGQAFQLSDDLIDVTGMASSAGKKTAKDAERGKATLVAIYGVDEARRRLDETAAAAIAILEPFGSRGAALTDAARFIASRDS